MGIRFDLPHQPAKFYTILIPEVGITYKAALGHDPATHRTTDMHYLKELNRTTPCLHDDCAMCLKAIPAREQTYVPASVWYGPLHGWHLEILSITDSWKDILKQDLRRFRFNIKRKGGRTSVVSWELAEEKPAGEAEFPGFNIESSLYRAWGLRKGR